jgi:hypothetical protein
LKLDIPTEFRDTKNVFFVFTLTYKDEQIQELTKLMRGSEVECEFALEPGQVRLPSSIRLIIDVRQKQFCWRRKTLHSEKYSLAQLKKNPQMKKGFRIDQEKFNLQLSFRKDDQEMRESLLQNKLDSVKVLSVVNEREPFIPIEDEMKYEEIEHPIKKMSTIKQNKKSNSDTREVTKNLKAPEGILDDEVKDPDVLRNLFSLLY